MPLKVGLRAGYTFLIGSFRFRTHKYTPEGDLYMTESHWTPMLEQVSMG